MDPQKQRHFQKNIRSSSATNTPSNFSAAACARSLTQKSNRTSCGLLLDVEIERLETEHHAPVNVLTKTADAMPGFGIVAAVLGIVVTMASISGPIEMIGEHVAAALVGTFLGILLSYGYMNPLAMNLEFVGAAETGLHPLHRRVRHRFRRRHGARHRG